VEAEEGKQARLSTFLDDLPTKTYRNAEELFVDIRSAKKKRG
jgi:hypothetical protein